MLLDTPIVQANEAAARAVELSNAAYVSGTAPDHRLAAEANERATALCRQAHLLAWCIDGGGEALANAADGFERQAEMHRERAQMMGTVDAMAATSGYRA
jgi:hypothetical protein